MKTTPVSLFGLAAVAGITLATTSTTLAAVVFVTVTGYANYTPPQGQPYPTSVLGNRNFTADYSYDDSVVLNPTTTLYDGAVTSFNITFTGGSVFTATGGTLRTSASEFSIVSLVGANFPTLSGMNYSNFILFKFRPSGTVPMDRLPTAAELASGYVPWYTWISYGGNPNSLVLTPQGEGPQIPRPHPESLRRSPRNRTQHSPQLGTKEARTLGRGPHADLHRPETS